MATISTTSDGTLAQAKLKDRTRRANHVVRNHSIVSGALGIIPIPPLGVVLITANGLNMVNKLSSIYAVEFKKDVGKSAIGSFLAACGTFSISGRLVWALSTALPVASPVLGIVTRPIFSTAMMYIMGNIFIQHFESGGTFLTFNAEKVREHYAELYAEDKEAAKT